ncbi:hypothetical protein SAMN05421743_12165 [Thalassobacillus cyri]|uniref:Uncharacterized protein n=1 Tax=Thalassobacillus cyri TaxID=571932 RepID=A0A1H4H2S8_9BACI|nr:hypothetical protein [Thalassobacillus cyri]SEB15941.1 hypothetical protein SAMN05421743_12165 [Thalassobacillus cyri]
MKAVEGMSSVVMFTPQETEEERFNKFNDWLERHSEERIANEFRGPVVPGPVETRAMLNKY